MKVPVKAPRLQDLLSADPSRASKVIGLQIGPEVDGVYDHWDHLRQLTPPHGLTSEEWWLAIRFARMSIAREIPLLDKDQKPFRVSSSSSIQRKLHFIDREAAGAILGADVTSDHELKRQLMRSLIEEAMTSSQLEGASTTSQIAKEMLSTGRTPRDRSEQMIHNNFAMMQALQRWQDRPITPAAILEIHRLLMTDAIDDPGQAGRLRNQQDNVVVQDRADRDVVLHVPPPASELPGRLQKICDFANGGASGEFLHPVIRAIAIHFQIGYDHPFCDGNGRTARALFYWSMLRSGYWLTQYISISSVLKKAPGKYVRAYLYTEADSSDLTYFVAHQLDVIEKAINSFRDYLSRKRTERARAEALLRPTSPLGSQLNYRQRELLMHAVRKPGDVYDIASHQATHRVSYPTARADLLALEQLGLLSKRKRGKGFAFVPAADLGSKLDADAL
jgi:Fic family protein